MKRPPEAFVAYIWNQQRTQDDVSQVQARWFILITFITTSQNGYVCARILSLHGIERTSGRRMRIKQR